MLYNSMNMLYIVQVLYNMLHNTLLYNMLRRILVM